MVVGQGPRRVLSSKVQPPVHRRQVSPAPAARPLRGRAAEAHRGPRTGRVGEVDPAGRVARRRSRVPPFAWLPLDRGDNDPVRFWTYVVEALRPRHAGIEGRSSLPTLEAPRVDIVEDVLPALGDELATSEHGIVLVLDDYHLITNPQIQESVAAFVDHLPRVLELAIATRSTPALPLARLRPGARSSRSTPRTSASRSRTRSRC